MISKEILDGDFCVFQDDDLYKFTSDAILLSKFVKAKKNEVVADFCAGSGIVGLNFFALNKNLVKSLSFFEVQTPFCHLITKSVKENQIQDKCTVVNTKIQDIGKEFNEKFSLILCNPPYFKPVESAETENLSVKIAREEVLISQKELINMASKCLKFGGRLAMVHIVDRLIDVIALMRENNIEPKKLQFISAKNKAPYLFIIEGTKGGKSGLKVLKNGEN